MAQSASETLVTLRARFDTLSPRLRDAARFLLDRPREVALYSMRAAAARAGVHPTSMLRLARELGFDGYDALRDQFRVWLNTGDPTPWSTRAGKVRKHAAQFELIDSLMRQETVNLSSLASPDLYKQMVDATQLIRGARHIYIVGFRSLYPVAFYLSYGCRMFMANVTLVNGPGGTFADELRTIGKEDVLIAFSYEPYTKDTITAVEFALRRGARLVAVTDSIVSAISKEGQTVMVVSNETPSLFHSVLPALAVAESLIALLLAESHEETIAELKRSEEQLEAFGVYFR